MNNPPEGWYPDPTGQPTTIRWWDGMQWTTMTEKEPGSAGSTTEPTAGAAHRTADARVGTGEAAVGTEDSEKAAEDTAGSTTASTRPSISTPASSGVHWTQQSLPEPAQSEVAQSEVAQSDAGQSDAGQSEPRDSPGPGTPTWPMDDAAATEQEPTPWQRSADAGAQTQNWPQSPAQPWSQQPGQGGSDQSDQSWSQQADQNWTQQPEQDWSQQPAQSWPQASAAQSPPTPAEEQWQNPAGQQWQAGPQNQWQPAAGGQQYPQPPLGPISPQSPDRKQGSKTPLLIAGAVVLVLIVAAGVFFIINRGDHTADPGAQPTTQPTSGGSSGQPSSTTTPSGGQSSVPPGQSKNPKLHEGQRITSDAISFPRQAPPWSDRKRLVPQLVDSSGQYVLLQAKFDGKNDWYADVFVGALGTSVLFSGDPQPTASDLSFQLRSSLYGDIPVTIKPLRNGAVKRSGKSGWYYQQTVTAKSAKVTARTLVLTVAVFDLGDGTAVGYISDIPANRPDLRAAESQVYKGINVG